MSRAPASLTVAVAFTLVMAACSKPAPSPSPLTVIAPESMASLAQDLVAGFNREQRDVHATAATVAPRQIPAALSGDQASVSIWYVISETPTLSQTVIALDALAVTVALTNPVESLTVAQIGQVFTGQVSNWAEVGGRAQVIVALSREEGALTREVFEQAFIGQGLRVTRNALVASSDPAMVAMIQATPGAIGYALLRTLTPQVRPLRIGGVPASAAAIQQGKYALVLPVAVSTQGPPRKAATAFLSYVRARAGQAVLQSWGLVAVQ